MFELNTTSFIVIFVVALLLILVGMGCFAWADGDNKKRLCKIGIAMVITGCVLSMSSLNIYNPQNFTKSEARIENELHK